MWQGVLAVLTIAILLLAPAGSLAQTDATPVSTAGDFAGLVDIGGRRLYLECRGVGSPTVVLEAGFRTRADVWTADLMQPESPRTMVFGGVAEFTRVCAYDRPGTATGFDDRLEFSRSDPVTMPRTAAAEVQDLHTLLAAAGETGPFVLVGHSWGGLLVRLFASTYPDEVVGLVLVDALPETLDAFMSPEQYAAFEALIQEAPDALADYHDLEFVELEASYADVRGAAPLHQIPLFVLSRGQTMSLPPDQPSGLTGDTLQDAWDMAQAGLAGLLPGARHVIAHESEHYIQIQQPDLVIDAVSEVVEAVRDPATWEMATPVSP